MATANPAEKLIVLVGAEHVAVREDHFVVAPANTNEVSAVMKFANENSLTVNPIGGGTKQSWGNPVRANIYLDLTRLNRVIEHPWQDLTCTVQAGCTWQHLQQTLAKHGQFVALDPLWPERATVGGILATNDSGALRHKYGSLRDLVIGMTLVLADGTIARSGGKVVKNVAGYDLCKLLTGSLGTLAIITEATFRLHPLPQHAQTFTVSAPQAAQLGALMQSIRASHLLTQALQLRGDPNGFHLDIQINAHPEAHQSDILRQMTAASGLQLEEQLALASPIAPRRDNGGSTGLQPGESDSDPGQGFSPGPLTNVWAARELLFQPDFTTFKLSVLPADIGQYLDHMQWAPEVEVACVAQSSGLIYASLDGTPTFVEKYLHSIKTDFAVLATSTNVNHWKAEPNSLPLMQRVKHQFDPSNTLNPGRFLVAFLLAFALLINTGCGAMPIAAPIVSAPALVGGIAIPYIAYSSVMVGASIVALTASSHIIMVDVSDPVHPSIITTVDTSALGVPDGLATDGAYLYVGMYDTSTFAIYSLANPRAPTLISSVPSCAVERTVLLSGTYAYIGCAGAMAIVNIANPAAPVLTGTYAITDVANANISSIALSGQVATLGFSTPAASYVRTVDVSVPSAPVMLGDLATLHSLQRATMVGSGLYTSFFDTSVVNAFSLSNPAAITQIGSLTLPSGCEGTPLVPANGLLYLGCFGGGLARINVSDPTQPTLKDFTAAPSFQSISISGQYLFGTDDLDATGPQLHVYTLGTNP